jgi:hypothetical protein
MDAGFLKQINNKFKFALFALKNLPSAYFSGVRLKNATETECTVTVPYKWFSRNPFQSTYFACLAMAAEMSTGILALGNIWKKKPAVSMLVTDIKGEFYKKATGITTFICTDGALFKKSIEECIQHNTAVTVSAKADGFNENKELIASFSVTWSFKARSK